MTRREAIAQVALLTGAAVTGSEAFLTGCTSPAEPAYVGLLTEHDRVRFMNEVAETILPATERSPGAKAARVGEFMNVMVTECYDQEEQLIFLTGIDQLKAASLARYDKDFLGLTPEQRHVLLLELEAEVKARKVTETADSPPHYYQLMKQLTLVGFLTSEIGMTKAMRHAPIPGRFDPCVPVNPGDKVWS